MNVLKNENSRSGTPLNQRFAAQVLRSYLVHLTGVDTSHRPAVSYSGEKNLSSGKKRSGIGQHLAAEPAEPRLGKTSDGKQTNPPTYAYINEEQKSTM